jgi:hypothetical protein
MRAETTTLQGLLVTHQPMYRLSHTAVMKAMSATMSSAVNVKLPCGAGWEVGQDSTAQQGGSMVSS